MLQNIQQLTSGFQPITFSEMENVSLLDRVDSKYCFNIKKLDEILPEMLATYRLHYVNDISFQRYETLYLDTPNFNLYKEHHNGLQNRFKIRIRNYMDSKLFFFEIKHKNNKGRTVKYRMKTEAMKIEGDVEKFLFEKTNFSTIPLDIKLKVYYSRLTFVNTGNSERVTLDFLLSFENGISIVDFPNLIFAEVKQNKSSLTSPFIKIMHQKKIHEGCISKYCLGVAGLYPEVKKNLFKEQIIRLKKLAT